jgi:hypothetical protein
MNPKQNHTLTRVENREIELNDLAPADEQVDSIKGGEDTPPVRPPDGGGFINNQTTLTNEEDEVRLADLEMTVEQAEQTQAGTGSSGGRCTISEFHFVKKTE